ncbi:MAG: extradiol dioxygenase [Thermoplasmata archaeon]|nr:extradiol dioxygenase [Thermoplasmata archaeon]
MISGAHAILYSKDADADREFFRDVLRFRSVDAGDGWHIFALPPAEVAVHPADKNGRHELFLMCDDLDATIKSLRRKKVRCSAPVERDWGTLTMVTLPGGGKLGVYQPKHPLAHGRGLRSTSSPSHRPFDGSNSPP